MGFGDSPVLDTEGSVQGYVKGPGSKKAGGKQGSNISNIGENKPSALMRTYRPFREPQLEQLWEGPHTPFQGMLS